MRRLIGLCSAIAMAAIALGGCAGIDDLVSPPGVSLRNVHAEELDFDRQTFLLSFDVTNPNPFPLPLTEIRYGIELDGMRFASGSTPASVDIPAGSDGEFAIRVEMDLVSTVPDLLFVLKDGMHRDIPYSLEGELHTSIPGARPVHFASDGAVRLLDGQARR
jgi:LEA14-like dessication related protein